MKSGYSLTDRNISISFHTERLDYQLFTRSDTPNLSLNLTAQTKET